MTTTPISSARTAPTPRARRRLRASTAVLTLLAPLALTALGGTAGATSVVDPRGSLAPTDATTSNPHPAASSSDVVVDWSRIVFEAAMTDDGATLPGISTAADLPLPVVGQVQSLPREGGETPDDTVLHRGTGTYHKARRDVA